MAPPDGLDALEQRRADRAGKRRLPPARHPKVEAPRSEEPAAEGAESAPAPEVPAEPASVTPPGPSRATERAAKPEPAAEPAARRRSRVRATQVHLDEAADEHLTELRKRAVMADVDLSASAILRLGLSELVERLGYDGIVELFASDESRPRRGRPRI